MSFNIVRTRSRRVKRATSARSKRVTRTTRSKRATRAKIARKKKTRRTKKRGGSGTPSTPPATGPLASAPGFVGKHAPAPPMNRIPSIPAATPRPNLNRAPTMSPNNQSSYNSAPVDHGIVPTNLGF